MTPEQRPMGMPQRQPYQQPKKSSALPWILGLLAGGGLLVLICCGVGGFMISRAVDQVAGTGELPEGVSYNEWRSDFQSNLIKHGPAPQEFDDEPIPENVSLIQYPSGNLSLKAWVYRPPGVTKPAPALLFMHGGFAFGVGDLEACRSAMDKGFVVMAPAVRGENGNPGEFELFLGEVDDARAAAQWLAKQPDVDPNRIYAFGHSVGGGITSVLSLLDDVPIQHCGSSGGLYPADVFLGWSDICPFRNSPEERMARLLIGNISHMQRPHYAYLGAGDDFGSTAATARKESGSGSLLEIETVPGDHFTSFDESLRRYLERAK